MYGENNIEKFVVEDRDIQFVPDDQLTEERALETFKECEKIVTEIESTYNELKPTHEEMSRKRGTFQYQPE